MKAPSPQDMISKKDKLKAENCFLLRAILI
jgi:hypothetical protein